MGIHGQLAEQFYLLIQTPLDRRAGAAPRSVPTQQTVYIVAPTSEQFYLFKHHLTGEAWAAWLFSLR